MGKLTTSWFKVVQGGKSLGLKFCRCNVRDQVAGEQAYQSRNVIALDESTLVIHKDTNVNHCTER